MNATLHALQHCVNPGVASRPNDGGEMIWHVSRMPGVDQIHSNKEPRRTHFIEEWMQRRDMIAADLARATGANPGTVSRWLQGHLPRPPHQKNLADVFEIEVSDLFRHPDDDWMSRFLKGRSADERERIKATLEAAFPRRVA